MKKYLATLVILLVSSFATVSAQTWGNPYSGSVKSASQQQASITFKNKSDYTMTLKIMKEYGGVYSTVILSPRSSRTVSFSSTSSYKLKIKAVHNGIASYHDGGNFSVTCNEYEWTEGTMEFMLSTYGSGLGPRISAKEFESNY